MHALSLGFGARYGRDMKRALLPLAAIVPLLGACGSPDGYPSLARRPAERISGSAPVASATAAPAPMPVLPTDLSLQAKLARLSEQARAAHDRFAASRPGTQRLVAAARGAAPASESWSAAAIALAQLESRRSDAAVALADLDSLYIQAKVDGGDSNAIATVRDQVTAWVADEDAVLADLRSQLRS